MRGSAVFQEAEGGTHGARVRPAPWLGRRARVDAVVRTAAGSALWLGLLLVTYWWVADGAIQDLGGWVSGLDSVGRLAGLMSSLLLLAQVLLMARVPVLESAFGQDRLAHLHRLVGFTSFNLMLAHVVAITWGYAGGELGRTPATLWDLVVHYPGMLLATGGTVALVMVVVTSIKSARRRIRYESWHLMHLYAYLGVGLALPHQLWTGQEFLSSPAKTVFWWSVWALTAAAVLVWRVGLPISRNLRHRLTVTSVVAEGDGVASVHVTGRRLDRLPVEAGQFLSWRFLAGPGWTRANPYSLSAAPDGRSLRITVQAVGDGSIAASGLRAGTRALVEGPYGRLSARTRTQPKVALIGAGVGITPLRALAEGLGYQPGDAVLLQRYTSEPLFTRELDLLARHRGLRVLSLPGPRRSPDSWLGDHVGTVDDTTALRYWVPDIAERDVYVCGPELWTALVRATLLEAGVPPDLIHVETFAW
jgi:predicted ferric reductase